MNVFKADSTVYIDANVLINLCHVSRLALLGSIPGLRFILPDQVYCEVSWDEDREALNTAIAGRILRVEPLTELDGLALYAELAVRMGKGEAACLAMACTRGGAIASDEKGRFRREALARLGETRIMGTVDIYVMAIRSGILSVEEADADKATLEGARFRMPFSSFGERTEG